MGSNLKFRTPFLSQLLSTTLNIFWAFTSVRFHSNHFFECHTQPFLWFSKIFMVAELGGISIDISFSDFGYAILRGTLVRFSFFAADVTVLKWSKVANVGNCFFFFFQNLRNFFFFETLFRIYSFLQCQAISYRNNSFICDHWSFRKFQFLVSNWNFDGSLKLFFWPFPTLTPKKLFQCSFTKCRIDCRSTFFDLHQHANM